MTPTQATFELKAMVTRGARISWDIPHALERARERDIPLFEAERVIRNGHVVRVDAQHLPPRWRVAGYDSDGRPIHVVVAPHPNALRVVTVTSTDE